MVRKFISIRQGLVAGAFLIITIAAPIVFFLYQYFLWAPKILTDLDEVPTRPWAVILGAKVWGDRPSPMLEDRLMTAYELFRRGKIKKTSSREAHRPKDHTKL